MSVAHYKTDVSFQLGQTPPRSNNSFGGHDDNRRYISSGLNNQQMNLMELTKMFPTPPSLEQHHPSSSPCGAGGPSDHQLDVIDSPHTASFSEEEIEVSQVKNMYILIAHNFGINKY